LRPGLCGICHYDFPGKFDDPRRPPIPDKEMKSRFAENKVIKKLLAAF
jgi:hypothetical protein